MVKANERLWTEKELNGMSQTVSTLRRMRSAATLDKTTLGLRMRKKINNLLGGKEKIYSPQEALADAEELGYVAGDFFAAKLSKTTHGKTEFEKWQDLLSDAEKQYTLYGETTYAGTGIVEVAGQLLIGRMRTLHIDSQHMLEWDLLENNNLGAQSIQQLINQDVGIISPLSGDYLMSSIYSSYLQRTRGNSFAIRPAALSEDLTDLVLPLDKKSNFPFENKSAIAIYVDTIATGNTAKALFKHLQGLYPQKIIPPNLKRKEYYPSDKITKYWAAAK